MAEPEFAPDLHPTLESASAGLSVPIDAHILFQPGTPVPNHLDRKSSEGSIPRNSGMLILLHSVHTNRWFRKGNRFYIAKVRDLTEVMCVCVWGGGGAQAQIKYQKMGKNHDMVVHLGSMVC